MKKIIGLSFIVLFSVAVSAQVVYDYLKSADAYFAKADYASAAEYYEKYLGKGNVKIKGEEYDPYTVKNLTKQQKVAVSNKQQAVYKLAECYRHLNFHVKAEPLYAEASKFDKTQFPLAAYWYGKTLRALEKYDAADSVLTGFTSANTVDANYTEDAIRELQNLKFIKVQLAKKDLNLYTVTKSAANINAGGANYAPVKLDANTILFTSTRTDSGAPKNSTHTNRVYTAAYNNGTLDNIKKAALPQTTSQHQGILGVTPDGNTIYLTKWSIVNGKKSAALYSSKKATNNNWSEPVLLDSTINIAGASTQQPFIMPDAKHLLYSSDRKDGFGGFDLWYADLDASGNVVAGSAKNLGSIVNTKYDEQAPYYHAASSALVFSSNGNIGMGGYDFFQSKGNLNNWSKPENLGYPLNSVKDDIYFLSNGSAKNILGDVLFSSDRSSLCCTEMFSLAKIRPIKQIKGLVVDCDTKQPLVGASVEVVNSVNKVLMNKATDADGTYSFTTEDFDNFVTSASANGYNPNKATTSALTDDELVNQTLNVLCLNKIPPPPPPPPPAVDTIVVMDNIYFDFNKATILTESYAAIDNQIVEMMNKYPTMVIEVGGHTDSKGDDNYNMKLSQARAESVRKYLISKGIAAERIEAKGYGESKPVAPNEINGKDNPDGRKKNRRTEFKVLHY